MDRKDTHVIIHFDGRQWGPAQYHRSEGAPLIRIRELLKGRWTRSSGHIERDGVAAFWNSNNGHRVLVMTEAEALKLTMGVAA